MLDFSKPVITLLIGHCGSGKSNALKSIILNESIKRKNFKFGLTFVKTKYNDQYDYLPDKYVIQDYDENKLKQWIQNLEKKKVKPHNFIIFDDLLGLLTFRSKFLLNFLATHRHTNTSVFICAQHVKQGSSTLLRELVNYAIIFNSKRKDTIQVLYEEFGQLFDSLQEFKQHFFKATKEKYNAMFYDSSIQDKENNYKQIKFQNTSEIKLKLNY